MTYRKITDCVKGKFKTQKTRQTTKTQHAKTNQEQLVVCAIS